MSCAILRRWSPEGLGIPPTAEAAVAVAGLPRSRISASLAQCCAEDLGSPVHQRAFHVELAQLHVECTELSICRRFC